MAATTPVTDMSTWSVSDQMVARGFAVVASRNSGAEAGTVDLHTVGLHEAGLPEIIVSGFGRDRAWTLAAEAAEWLLRHGRADGLDKVEVLLAGESLPVHLVSVPTSAGQRVAAQAVREQSVSGATYVRLCVQDSEGKWPWDLQCRTDFSTTAGRVLGEPSAGAF